MRRAITLASLLLALAACADVLGLEVLVETPTRDAGAEAAAPAQDAAATD